MEGDHSGPGGVAGVVGVEATEDGVAAGDRNVQPGRSARTPDVEMQIRCGWIWKQLSASMADSQSSKETARSPDRDADCSAYLSTPRLCWTIRSTPLGDQDQAIRLPEETRYTAVLGYDWESEKISSGDRKAGTALERDLNLTANGVFAVQVPNRTYDVTVGLGDLGSTTRDQMGIYLEGVQVDVVSTSVRRRE
jgi:hypothetical protein